MTRPKDDLERVAAGMVLSDPSTGTHPVFIPPKLPRMSDALEAGFRLLQAGAPVNPLQTGLSDIDEGLRMFGGKEITMLAADSGVGKSTIATQTALHAGAMGHGVVYLNLEMSQEMYGLRTLANYARVPVKSARAGEAKDDGLRRMTSGIEALRVASGRIALGNASEHRTIPAIKAFCKHAAEVFAEEGKPLKLVIVDHILQVLVNVRNDTNAEGKARADMLKELADAFDAHVLALVHITREGSKSGTMPTKNQLASSAWFDRHADNILIFHQKRAANGTFATNKATMSCQKARWGEPFAVELEYQGGFFYPWSLGAERCTP